MKIDVNKMVRMSVLAALSIVLLLIVRFPIIPAANFLEYEPADVPILIGAFMYGPVEGFIITVLVSLIQALTVSASSGWVGFVMHVIATGTLVIISGLIYKLVHSYKGAVIALAAGSLAMTLVMIPANLFFTVNFYGVPVEVVEKMLPSAILPFNLIKSFVNSIIVILSYKPICRILHNHPSKTVIDA